MVARDDPVSANDMIEARRLGASAVAPDLAQLGRLVWDELPLLAAIDLLLALTGSVVAVTAVTLPLVAPLLAALLVGPVWIGATAICLRLLDGESPGVGALLREIRRRGWTGVGIALAPALVATLLLGSLGIASAGMGQGWMAAPIAADVLALIVLMAGGIMAFVLAVTTELRPRERWLAALALAGRNLVPCAGIASGAVLLALSVRYWGPFAALVLVAPFCLLTTAAARAALRRAAR